MAHHHSHHKPTGLTIAFWLNLFLSAIEIAGGIFTNSTAIIADAFHDFMDAFAIGAAVVLEKVSQKKRSPNYSYGYKRFSLLSALCLCVFLLAGAVIMIVNAVQSFIHPHIVNSVGMWWLAVLGISVNGFAFFKLKKENTAESAHSHNSKAVMLHLLEDVLGWVAVLIGAAVIYFTHWYWIDALLAIGIAMFISYNALNNLIEIMKVLLQAIPPGINLSELSQELCQIKGVNNIHDLHVWSLDGNYHIASLHAVCSIASVEEHSHIYDAILQILDKHSIQHPTIQIETTNTNCKLKNC